MSEHSPSQLVLDVLGTVTDFVSAVDADGRYTYLNERALGRIERSHGRPIVLDDLVGQSVWEASPEIVGTRLEHELRQVLRDPRPYSFQAATPDHETWLDVHVYPAPDGGLWIYGHDITVRHLGHEQLEAANLRAEDVVESISDSFFAVDQEWRYTYLNRRAVAQVASALGREMSADGIRGMRCWEVFPEWAGTAVSAAFEHALRERETTQFEVYAARLGQWLEARLYPTPNGVSAFIQDITDRKRATEQLAYHASLLENMEDAVLATDRDFVLTAWNPAAERMFGFTVADALGRKVYDLIPTDDTEADLAARLWELTDAGRVRPEGTWYGKDGGAVQAEAITVALRADGQISGYLSIIRDCAERIRTTAKLHAAARQQALLVDLSLCALGNHDLQALLDDAVKAVADVLEVELSSIGQREPDGDSVIWRAVVGWSQEAIAQAPPSRGGTESLAGYAIMVGAPVVSEDVATDKRFAISALSAEAAPASAAAVLIPARSPPFGVLTAASRQRRTFDDAEVGFMQAVANVVGIALERSEAERRASAARDAERTRIARELHDNGLRELSEALGLATVARSLAADQGDEHRWAALTEQLQRVSQQLRSAIYDLRFSAGEERSFVDLLEDLVQLQAGLALTVTIALHGRASLPEGSLGRDGTEALQIVREAITNARRHSGARNIVVDAGRSTGQLLCLDVNDDGQWSESETHVRSGHGLGIIGMRERAHGLGATLRIGARTGGGTTVSLVLRLAARA